MVTYAQQVVDVMNAWSALLHFPERDSAIVDLTFVEGGALIDRDVFAELLSLEGLGEVREHLGRVFRSSMLAQAFRHEDDELATLEVALLRAQIAEQNRTARTHPEGTAPFISFALGLRAEVLDLRRIIWGVSLEVPPAMLETDMVAT